MLRSVKVLFVRRVEFLDGHHHYRKLAARSAQSGEEVLAARCRQKQVEYYGACRHLSDELIGRLSIRSPS